MTHTKRAAGHGARMTLALALVLSTAVGLGAQETTERYIPVGMSPGVSGVSAVIGTVVAADEPSRTITVQVEGEAEPRTVPVTPDTRIWLDRSPLREVNTVGSFADVTVGRTVEVKYVDPEPREAADWVKVLVEGDPRA